MTALGRRIYSFANSQLNRRVGNGQCWTLAFNAIRDAHGQTPTQNSRYEWGQVIPINLLEQGDIVQFTSYFATITHIGGDVQTVRRGRPNHTAIVSQTFSNGEVEVLEQNVRPNLLVQRSMLFLQSGTFGSDTVAVSGRVVCYRVT